MKHSSQCSINCKFDHSLTNSCCKDYKIIIFLNFVEGEKMEGSLILSSLGRKSKPHPPRNRSYQWRLLCLNQLVPFIVDYAYVIWSTFLYVTNCLYNGSLLNIYFPVLWCSVFLPLCLLLIYSKYDKFFFFISYRLSLKLDLILFSSLARKTSICWWKVIDLFVLGSAAIYSSCSLVLNWVF